MVDDSMQLEPTVLGAAWRYRMVVVLFALAGLALGFGFTVARPLSPQYVATAVLIIGDPSSREGLSVSALDRYTTNQVEVMQSSIVYEGAARLLVEQALNITARDLIDGITITSNSSSDLVTVSFQWETPEGAVAGTNALVDAYQGVSGAESSRTVTAALERIDTQLAGLEVRLEAVQADIVRIIDEDLPIATLEQQFENSLIRLAEVQAQLATASTTDPDPLLEDTDTDLLLEELSELREQIDTYRLVRSIERPNSELAAAQEEQSGIIAQRADLLTLRDEMAIGLELAPTSVNLLVPADTAAVVPPLSLSRILAGGLVLGLVVGTAFAYWLVLKRRTFRSKMEPEPILAAPWVADAFDLSSEPTNHRVPVRDKPHTPAAEAYRFAAASLELKANSSSIRTVMAISAMVGRGKTTILANLAFGLVRQGHNVLVVDADFGNQELSWLVAPDAPASHPGLSEVLDGVVPVERALQDLPLGNDAHLFLVARGRGTVEAADLLRRPSAHKFFRDVAQLFDIVLVDGPPLLQVAYSSALLGCVDAGLVIVPHGSSVGELEEVANRMSFIAKPTLGYIYSRPPTRRDLTSPRRSHADVQVKKGLEETVPRS